MLSKSTREPKWDIKIPFQEGTFVSTVAAHSARKSSPYLRSGTIPVSDGLLNGFPVSITNGADSLPFSNWYADTVIYLQKNKSHVIAFLSSGLIESVPLMSLSLMIWKRHIVWNIKKKNGGEGLGYMQNDLRARFRSKCLLMVSSISNGMWLATLFKIFPENSDKLNAEYI